MRRCCDRVLGWAPAVLCAVLYVLLAAPGVPAQAAADSAHFSELPDEAVVLGRRDTHVRLVVVKDPTLAMVLSVGAPGMGQIYAGRWQRGLAFMGGVAASLVAVGLAADELPLRLEDYDRQERGGNGDGVVQVAEHQKWEDNPRREFGDISTARRAVIPP